MPRYFFHRSSRFCDERDDEGFELANLQAARAEAVTYAGASLAEEPGQIADAQDLRVEVTDEFGTLLFTVVAYMMDGPITPEPTISRPSEAPGKLSG